MGYFSDKAIEQNENPRFYELDKTVCVDCVRDSYLAKLVLENAVSRKCSYCDKQFKSNKAATYPFIIEEIHQAVFNYYADAQDLNLPWDRGWIIEATYIGDILPKFDPGWCCDLYTDLLNSFDPFLHLVKHSNNDWLEIPENEALKYSWDSFKNQILYKTRYLFLTEPNDELSDRQIIPVGLMLNALSELCVEFNLIKLIRKNSIFYRVRSHSENEVFNEFDQIGVAPKKIASAGRMNPAGIPYFYISNSLLTAKNEVITNEKHWSYGAFKLKKDVEVIDFSNLPNIPSIFDTDNYKNRQKIIFLYDLVDDMSKPIKSDDKEHIEYIPTQVVSEFFRYRFKQEIKGIKYNSVKNPKGINIAFFESDNDQIKDFFRLLSIKKN
ncbi:MAG: RES domain-containing protein [Acinetobacter sp.]|nr:RES domain-containing protein [Acinetobacter sp.]